MNLDDLDNELSYYNGIHNLRSKSTVVPKLTKLQKLQKARQKIDIIYFCEAFSKVNDVDLGFELIKLRDYQKKMALFLFNYKRVVFNTSRQVGKTTIVGLLLVHYLINNDHKTIGIVSNDATGSLEVLLKIKEAYVSLPLWMQHNVVKWNDGSIMFSNGSRVITSAPTPTAFTGRTLAWLYIDEVAKIDPDIWYEFSKSVLPTIASSKTARISYTSTPKGYNHFYKIVQKCLSGTSRFKYIEVPWTEVPDRDEEWKKNIMDDMDVPNKKLAFLEEYCCKFISSGDAFLDNATMGNMNFKDPIKDDLNGMLVYADPIDGHEYIMGVDVGEGKGGDYSVCQILDVTNSNKITQAAVYRNNKISTENFPAIIELLSIYYNNAMTLIENNSIGDGVINSLFYHFEFDNLVSNDKKNGKGIRTTKRSKPQILTNMKYILSRGKLKIFDFNTINEFSTFTKNPNGTFSADHGCTDDLIMALGMAAFILKLNLIDVDHEANVNEIKAETYHTIMV